MEKFFKKINSAERQSVWYGFAVPEYWDVLKTNFLLKRTISHEAYAIHKKKNVWYHNTFFR